MKKTCIACLAVVSLLAGCANQQPTIPSAPLEEMVQANLKIIYGTPTLANAIKFVEGNVFQDGRLYKCVGSFKNLTSSEFPIEYQVTWKDANGGSVQSPSSWQRVTMYPRSEKPITAIAKDVTARSAIVTIKLPQDLQIFIPAPDPIEYENYRRNYIENNPPK